MKLSSVRVRLTLWNVGVLALILVALGVALRLTVEANLVGAVDRVLIGRARHMAGEWRWRRGRRFFAPPPGPMMRPFPAEWAAGDGPPPERMHAPFRPRLLDLHGRDLVTGIPAASWDPDALHRSARGEEALSTVWWEGQPLRVLSAPLWRGGQVAGVLQMAAPLADLIQEVNRLTGTLWAMMPFALLIAGVGGAFLTDRALRPVRRITHAAGRIEAADLSGRLPVSGDDEFSELAATFNGMLGRLEEAFKRLERAFEQQRRFTADASHELRTPLTIIKANSSLALRGQRAAPELRQAMEAVDRAADTTTRIVQDLLLLARADAGQLKVECSPIRIIEALEGAAEAARRPEQAGIAVEVSDPSLAVAGSRHHLVRLFTNLIQNACRYTPVEGRITVAARGDGDAVVTTVADTGAGIPPEHLPHVCERFYRVDAARARQDGGTGLGLAICQSIVEAHGGSMMLDSVVGKGTTVTVRLPRAASDPPV